VACGPGKKSVDFHGDQDRIMVRIGLGLQLGWGIACVGGCVVVSVRVIVTV